MSGRVENEEDRSRTELSDCLLSTIYILTRQAILSSAVPLPRPQSRKVSLFGLGGSGPDSARPPLIVVIDLFIRQAFRKIRCIGYSPV
jgi:hypothetical protein